MKKLFYWLMWWNGIFLVLNTYFLVAGVAATSAVSLVASLLCLAGLVSSYLLYNSEE